MKHPELMFNFLRRKLDTVEAITEGRAFGSLHEIQSLVRSCCDVSETVADFDDLTEDGYNLLIAVRELNNMMQGTGVYTLVSLAEQIRKCRSLVGKKMFK